MHYVMGSNIAGYLPDGETWVFETYEEATAAMADDMELFADEWDEHVDYREEDYRAAAESCRDGSVSDHFAPLIGFHVQPSTDARVWWVSPCDFQSDECGHLGGVAATVCHHCVTTGGEGTRWEVLTPQGDEYGRAECIACHEQTLCNRALVRER